jgi:hypothetical protein
MADTNTQSLCKVGRPKKYQNDEERIAARKASQIRYNERNKEARYSYKKEYYAQNRDVLQEYGKQYNHAKSVN